jgi:glycosyltransferase involved in cell wall biosynthesis
MTVSTLSIVIPCYNEAATLDQLVERVLAADVCGLRRDLIIVDDGSTDGSVAVARRLAATHPEVRVFEHAVNQGKGAALRTGFQAATGDVVLVQDADLEYNPKEYPRLLGPILDGRADVVYGSRFRGGLEVRVLYFWHSLGNGLLTLLSNIFSNLNLTDMETCYKLFRREVIQAVTIQENRFGFEPEITAKVAHLASHPRIYEVGIGYDGRTYDEGKKISWKDGVRAIWCILRYNLIRS